MNLRDLLKGKLTYSALGVMLITSVCKALDVPLSETTALEIINALAILVGIYGRYRVTT